MINRCPYILTVSFDTEFHSLTESTSDLSASKMVTVITARGWKKVGMSGIGWDYCTAL